MNCHLNPLATIQRQTTGGIARGRVLVGIGFVVGMAVYIFSFNSTFAAVNSEKRPDYRRSKTTSDTTEAKTDRRKLLMTTGEDKLVDLNFEISARPEAVLVGNPETVLPQVVSKGGVRTQINFKPLKAGETTVTVRDETGNVQVVFDAMVTGSDLLERAAELRDLLRDIEGIDIRIVGQKIVIEGELLVPNDYARLLNVIQDKVYTDLVLNLTVMSPFALQFLAEKIQKDVQAFAENVRVRVVNGMLFLEGETDSEVKARRAAEVAKLYLPEVRVPSPLAGKEGVQVLSRSVVQNFIIVKTPPPKRDSKMVRITVHFVELSKDYLKIFGFKWQPGFTANSNVKIGQTAAGGTGATGGDSFSATLSNLFPKLANAQSAGYARILKTSTVLTRSGQPAKVKDQKQFPVVVQGQNGQAMAQRVPVGFEVAVTPSIMAPGEDISLDLDLTQSNVIGKTPDSGGYPITANHSVTTKLFIRNNESAAVVGVVSEDIMNQFNRDDPNVGAFSENTQSLFTLMRSKQYNKARSQFVIFVTPQIVDNASEGTEDLKRNFRVTVK